MNACARELRYASKSSKKEQKPEVRKAGGVYYTPEYIVRFIVENTVGKLITGKTPEKISEMRFADISCGSGSFLLAIYDLLLRHHTRYYNNFQSKARKRDCIRKDGVLHLTLEKKREILNNNIFGVDIDAQAVEVTQLSLYLKLLEDETIGSTRNYQLTMHAAILPSLNDNIICGNSLIEPEILDGNLFTDTEERELNPMDFVDAFPRIMKNGGFDVVVGNPPYIFTRERISEIERSYYRKKYKLRWEKGNTYMLFMERLCDLIHPKGLAALIVPNSWLTIESAKLLREKYLLRLQRVVDLNYAAFKDVAMEPSIFVISGAESHSDINLARIVSPKSLASIQYVRANRKDLRKHNRIVFHGSDLVGKLIDEMVKRNKSLGELFDVRTGLQAYERGKGTPRQSENDVKNHVFDRVQRQDGDSVRYLAGKDVLRYEIQWAGMWMQYGPWLSQPRDIGIFTRPRILLREITGRMPWCLHFAYMEEKFLNNKSILNILDYNDDTGRMKALLAVLNSHVISFYYKIQGVKSSRKLFPKVVIRDLKSFPIPKALLTTAYPRIVRMVDQMIAASKSRTKSKTDKDKNYYENRCATLNRQLDAEICILYGLTENDISLIEENS